MSDITRYDLDGGNLPPMAVTAEQLQAMQHALTDETITGLIRAEDVSLENPGAMGLVIEAYDSHGWLLVGYPWNTDGMPVWLATDGGWHFQPGETGYYPWRKGE